MIELEKGYRLYYVEEIVTWRRVIGEYMVEEIHDVEIPSESRVYKYFSTRKKAEDFVKHLYEKRKQEGYKSLSKYSCEYKKEHILDKCLLLDNHEGLHYIINEVFIPESQIKDNKVVEGSTQVDIL
jgi:predicted transcriptional regulator